MNVLTDNPIEVLKMPKMDVINKPDQIVDNSQVLPAGILVFTKWQTIFHKQEDGKESEGDYCYWGTNKLPKRFVEALNLENAERVSVEDNFRYELKGEFPIYMAVNGKIVGYFIIHDIKSGDYDDLNDQSNDYWLIFYSESWREIKDGETLKPSQGWRYYPKPVPSVS